MRSSAAGTRPPCCWLASCDDRAMGPAEGSGFGTGRVARPRAGGVVSRPGLFGRLGASARVTVVSAPPGSGKTVLCGRGSRRRVGGKARRGCRRSPMPASGEITPIRRRLLTIPGLRLASRDRREHVMRIGFAELGRSAATSGRSPPGRGDARQARDTTARSEHKELQLPSRQGRASQQQCGGRESQRRWRHRLTGNMRRQLPSRWEGKQMENKTLSWVMAARKFGIPNADEIFPEDDEPGRKRPAKKLVRTLAPKTGRCP
jgi:hypothetical protein